MSTFNTVYPGEEDPDAPDVAQRETLRDSEPGWVEYIGGSTVYLAYLNGGGAHEVSELEFRIIDQYAAAKRRQAEAAALAERRWIKLPDEPEDDAEAEEEPEAIPPSGKLTARQDLFCEHYASQPVATRAAVLAGYDEDNAAHQGSRLLKNPLVLTRIAALRAERKLRYVLDADTLQDKLEAVFFEALGQGDHSAAVSALRLQAGLARLPTRPAAAASDEAPKTAPRNGARKAHKSPRGGRKKPRKAHKRR